MTKEFTQKALSRQSWWVIVGLVCLSFAVARPASAQERILFTAVDNAQAELITLIRNEQVRIDVSMWLLTDRSVTYWIVQRHLQGLPVRVIGDRAGIFEADVNTRREFEYLASHGVPIRLRYHPTWFPEIIHWKCGIFAGQNVVEFGSANWTGYELRPFSSTDFKDETAFFTNDQALVNAFKTKFDQYWNDTQYFLDWPTVYRNQTGATWPTPMTIPRGRLEPDYPTTIPGMIWGQGSELNTRLIQEINRETQRIDFVTYRMTVPEITNALIARHQAGVPVRVFAEPAQYRNAGYPEYWLVGAEIDRLLVAGVPVKQRTHMGLTHMKSLVTSTVALVASSNFTRFWQRDHNYFVSASTKPAIHAAFLNRLDEMWNDTANYAPFRPLRPNAPSLVSPGNNWTDVPTTPRLEWRRAPFAVAFDVYLGPANGTLALVGRVNAQLSETPPETYSFTLPQPLQPGASYAWRVVSRTFATAIDPSLTSVSELRFFTTAGTPGGGTGGGSGPYNGLAVSLPGLIQAENFDEGASGVAYYDNTAGNTGGQYRSTNVDIEATSDTGGGYNVGWAKPGEWLRYTVNVTAAGTYSVQFRLASPGGGGTFHLEVNGVDRTGPITVPATGAWTSWATVSRDIALTAGSQQWRLVLDTAVSSVANFNYIRVVAPSGTPGGGSAAASSPFGGTAVQLPATIQVEDFDDGGAGVAFHDTTSGNTGGQYRSTNVDIGTATDTGGGFRLGWIDAGEWLNYTVNVAAAGTYDLEVRVASNGRGGTFHIEVDGVDKTGPLEVPNTGGWQAWVSVQRAGVALTAGPQVWRLVMDQLGPTGAVGNINWIRVSASGGTGGEAPVETASLPFNGTPETLPGRIQAEDYDSGGLGVAYHDLSSANEGGQYRSTSVDIAAAADTGGGYTLGWVGAGEWLNYTVNVAAAGTYDIGVRVASAGQGGTFHVEVNGVDVTGDLTVPDTGGWQTWSTIRRSGVSLAQGEQAWRLVMDSNGPATGGVGNINWMEISTTP